MWIYKCKINFYKCKLTCDKKLCQVIHSRSEISWKKPKKWIFGFLKFALPVPLPWALKSWAPSNFILSDTFPIFFWGGKLKNKYISYRELGVCGSSNLPFWSKLTFLKWNFGRMRAGSPAIPGLNKLAGEVLEVTLTLSLTLRS